MSGVRKEERIRPQKLAGGFQNQDDDFHGEICNFKAYFELHNRHRNRKSPPSAAASPPPSSLQIYASSISSYIFNVYAYRLLEEPKGHTLKAHIHY